MYLRFIHIKLHKIVFFHFITKQDHEKYDSFVTIMLFPSISS